MMENTAAVFEKAAEAVRRAAGAMHPEKMQVYEKGSAANLVTSCDLEVQRILTEKLGAILPGSALFGEEGEHTGFPETGDVWILDPIDGTTNFVHGMQHSAVSLALCRSGRIDGALVYDPYLDEMFTAVRGTGAFCNGKKMQVARRTHEQGLYCFGTCPYDHSHSAVSFRAAEAMFLESRDVRRTGSAALDLAYVAAGRYDGFFEHILQPWDFAAGELLVTEAGGIVTGWHGEAVDFTRPVPIAAYTPDSKDWFLDKLNKAEN